MTQPQAISGLGGIGKTQTAVEYAYRHRHDYQAVLWVGADTREAVVAGFVRIAELLGLPEKAVLLRAMGRQEEATAMEARAQAIRTRLPRHNRNHSPPKTA